MDQKQGQIARGRPSVGEKLQETKTNGDRRRTDYINKRGGDNEHNTQRQEGFWKTEQETTEKTKSDRKTNKSTNWRKTRRDIHSSPKWKLDLHLLFVIIFLIWKRRYFTHHVYSLSLLITHVWTNICSDCLFLHNRPRLSALRPFSSQNFIYVYFSISISFSCWFCLSFPNTSMNSRDRKDLHF